jgi:hypothetical protein
MVNHAISVSKELRDTIGAMNRSAGCNIVRSQRDADGTSSKFRLFIKRLQPKLL